MVLFCALPAGLALAQVIIADRTSVKLTAESSDADRPMPLVSADEEVAENLARAEKMFAEGKHDRAIRIIQDLVNLSEDASFVAGKDGRLFVSVAIKANELIGKLDDHGKERYRRLYDAQARAIYDKAIKDNDTVALYRVATNYLHTSSGPKALETLGALSFDRGKFALAAMYWRKRLTVESQESRELLLNKLAVAYHFAGEDAKSQACAKELAEKYPDATAEIGGKQQKLVDFVSAVRARPPIVVMKAGPLDDWPGWGGIPSGVGTMAECDVVLIPRWQLGYADQDIETRGLGKRLFGLSGGIDKYLLMQGRYYGGRPQASPEVTMRGGQVQLKGMFGTSGNKLWMPATLHPVVADNKLIFRGEDRVRAIDGLTGRVEWESVPLKMTRKEKVESRGWYGYRSGTLQLGDDGRYSLSVGGGKIYTVYHFLSANAEAMMHIPNSNSKSINSSKLAALSVGGRLLWTIGGKKDEDGILKACRFFTAPTYASGKIYALVMYHEIYHLVCLDADDGSLIWYNRVSQAPEFGVRSGIDPSGLVNRPSQVAVADGKCYVLTNAGVIAAFDAEGGRAYWAYQYRSEVASLANKGGVLRPANPIIVLGGQIVCLPADSSRMLVISGEEGKVLWDIDSKGQKHLTAIDGRRVLLSSPALSVIDVAAHKTVYTGAPRPVVMGRPAVTAGRVLASSEGKIHVLNLDDMKLDTMALARADGLLGNLISAGGKLYASNSAGVCAYFSYEMARKELTLRAEHEKGEVLAETLFERGRIAFDSLRFTEALADFKESLNTAEGTDDQRALAAQIQPWLYRSCVAMANTGERGQQMLAWFKKAELHAVSPREKAHLALRIVKYHAVKGDWPAAAKLAQKLSEECPDLEIVDVKIGSEADNSVRIEADDPTVLCKTLTQGLIADWILKMGRQVVYAEIDAVAGEEFHAASQGRDIDRLAGVGSRWPNSVWTDASQMAAAELCYSNLASPEVENPDELAATTRAFLSAVANKSGSPLRMKAEALLAVLWSRSGYPVIASLICSELKADPGFKGTELIQFADVNGTFDEILQQVAVGTVASGVSKLDVGISMPIQEVFRMDDEPAQILRDQFYRPVRLGEMLLMLKGPKAVMVETTDSSSDSAIRWVGLMTEINTADIMRYSSYPPSMRIVAGLSNDQKQLVIADRTQVAGFDVASAKVIYNKKLSELGIDAVYNLAVGSDVLVATTTTGQVTCINMSDGMVRWRGTTVGKYRHVVSPPQIGGGMVLTCNDNYKTLTCFDLMTGRLLANPWKANVFAQGFVTDSGLLVMMIDGELSVRDKTSLDNPMWVRKYEVSKRPGPVILTVSDDRIAVSPGSDGGIEILAVVGDGKKPLAAMNAGEGRKGVIPVDAKFAGDSLYVVGTANSQLANNRKRLYGWMSTVKGLVVQKFDIARSRLVWNRILEDDKNDVIILPLEIGRNHVAVTAKYANSNLASSVHLLGIDNGEPVEKIELSRERVQKKNDPMRMLFGPPVIMSGRLVVETVEGIKVYGNQ